MRTKGEVMELLVDPCFNSSGVTGQSGLEQIPELHVHLVPAYFGQDYGRIVCFLLVQCDGRSIFFDCPGSTGIVLASMLARFGTLSIARGPTLSPLPNIVCLGVLLLTLDALIHVRVAERILLVLTTLDVILICLFPGPAGRRVTSFVPESSVLVIRTGTQACHLQQYIHTHAHHDTSYLFFLFMLTRIEPIDDASLSPHCVVPSIGCNLLHVYVPPL